MKREQLLPYVGRIVALDLVNRERPVVRIKSISEKGVVSITNPVIYMPVPKQSADGSNVSYTVTPITYAAPLFEVTKMDIDCDHIICLIPVPSQMEQAYGSQFGGIVKAGTAGLIMPN